MPPARRAEGPTESSAQAKPSRAARGGKQSSRGALDLDEMRQLLLDRRHHLLARYRREEAEAEQLLESREPDWEDQAVDQRDANVLASLGEADRHHLDRIIAALRRIDEGTYGRCMSCGEEIPPARLRAIPETPFCTEDAGLRDRS
jgi:RNA polymerase-binding transcription factor DksA